MLAVLAGGAARAGEPAADVARLQAGAEALQLERDPVWRGLLHVEHGRSAIADSAFLLSGRRGTPADELRATIAALWGGGADALCRFPARYSWLRDRLDAPALPMERCADVAEFLDKASDDSIDLVFVADNLSSPSSILGHSFLKFSGRTATGKDASHAVSFYTDTSSGNMARLIFESVVTGRPGYFSLTPYADSLDLYLRGEKRRVWEYHLDLDARQRRLVTLHVLELKQVRQDYLYIGYNCATVVRFMLQLTGRAIDTPPLWTTPRDVVHAADRAGLIDRSQVHYPKKALVQALSEGVPASRLVQVRSAVRSGAVDTLGGDPHLLQLALALNDFLAENGTIDSARAQANAAQIDPLLAASGTGSGLSANPRIDPRKGQGERQVMLQAGVQDGQEAVRLTFIPASHLIMDDNRNRSHESELKLLALTVEQKRHGAPVIRELTLFGMKSFLPRNVLTGGLSGRFSFGFDTQRDAALRQRHPFAIDAGVGLTTRLAPDVDLQAMIGGGLGMLNLHPYAYANVQAGAIVREVWDMKTAVSLTSTISSITAGTRVHSLAVSQSKQLGRGLSLHVDWKRDLTAAHHQDGAFLGIKQVF